MVVQIQPRLSERPGLRGPAVVHGRGQDARCAKLASGGTLILPHLEVEISGPTPPASTQTGSLARRHPARQSIWACKMRFISFHTRGSP